MPATIDNLTIIWILVFVVFCLWGLSGIFLSGRWNYAHGPVLPGVANTGAQNWYSDVPGSLLTVLILMLIPTLLSQFYGMSFVTFILLIILFALGVFWAIIHHYREHYSFDLIHLILVGLAIACGIIALI